jgi:tellurite methyltransferase
MTLPLRLPPSPFIRDAVTRHEIAPASTVLDIGCHEGRNSLYLAGLGHRVLGVTKEWADVRGAMDIAAEAGLEAQCRFVVGDARQLPVRKLFDVVLVNEVLHMMARREAYGVLQAAKNRTAPGGTHLVSGYVVDPKAAILTEANRARCFGPGELADLYGDWDIMRYEEDESALQMVGQRQVVRSLARIVVREPSSL